MEWHDLEQMTIVKLREVGQDKGITSLSGKNKAEQIEELAGVLGIEKPHEELTDTTVQSKSDLKRQLRELKSQRNQLIEAHDHKGLKAVRRKAHGLKREIKKIHLAAQAK